MDHLEVETNKLYGDELLPELEISLIPSKLTSMCKIDLFGLKDDFMEYLVFQGILPDKADNDVQIIALNKVPEFVHQLREWYKKYRTSKVE